MLESITPGDRVLIIGGGTGEILEELLKRNLELEIVYLEASAKMLQRTIARVGQPVGTTFVQGDEHSLDTAKPYDCILACYFFDLFSMERLAVLVPLLANALCPSGKLLVADFYLSANASVWQRLLVKTMYLFFKTTCSVEANTLPPFRTVLQQYFSAPSFSVSGLNGLVLSEVYGRRGIDVKGSAK